MLNKKFGKYSLLKLISNLENEKKVYDEKLNQAESTYKLYPNEVKDIESLAFSRGTTKAIDLLNENLYNKLFNEVEAPQDDILLVYMLYFQIIKHPLIKMFDNKQKFWNETCKYFLNGAQNKTGKIY